MNSELNFGTFRKLYMLLDRGERARGLVLIFLMFINALLEGLCLGAFLPFISIIASPGSIHDNRYLVQFKEWLGNPSDKKFLVVSGVVLVSSFLAKNLFSLLLSWVQSSFLVNRQMRLEGRLLRCYIKAAYLFFLERNPADLTVAFRNTGAIGHTIGLSVLTLFSELLSALTIVIALAIIQPITTLISFAFLGFTTYTYYVAVRRKLRTIGETRTQFERQLTQWINQCFGGIKEIKVLGCEDFFIDKIMSNSRGNALAQTSSIIIGQTPRLFIETLAVASLTTIVLFIVSRGQESAGMLPQIGLFAVGSFRLMPSASRILQSILTIRNYSPVLDKAFTELTTLEPKISAVPVRAQPESVDDLPFKNQIELKGISFAYPGQQTGFIKDINLTLKKGESIAVVGRSGAGKSTLVDIIMGILTADSGTICIDEKAIPGGDSLKWDMWRQKFGYIPQSIYLSDDTIRRNIAFGVPDEAIDDERIGAALTSAQLDSFVLSLPNGLSSLAGDRGTRLSGGQRQRIGIARALYLNPEILVMDEATSALDNETERQLVAAIENLKAGRTTIVIAHRFSTIEKCDRVLFMGNGGIINTGTPSFLEQTCPEYRRLKNNSHAQEI